MPGHDTAQLDETGNVAFQCRDWRAQRIGWCLMTAAVAAVIRPLAPWPAM